MKAIWALEVGRAQRMDIERQDQGVTCKIHKSSRSSHEFAQDTPTSWIVRRRLKLIFARIAPADAPGVPFDLSQCGVERGVRPLLYAGHSFRGVALRIDHELTGSACRDAPHRAAEQVPSAAKLCLPLRV